MLVFDQVMHQKCVLWGLFELKLSSKLCAHIPQFGNAPQREKRKDVSHHVIGNWRKQPCPMVSVCAGSRWEDDYVVVYLIQLDFFEMYKIMSTQPSIGQYFTKRERKDVSHHDTGKKRKQSCPYGICVCWK